MPSRMAPRQVWSWKRDADAPRRTHRSPPAQMADPAERRDGTWSELTLPFRPLDRHGWNPPELLRDATRGHDVSSSTLSIRPPSNRNLPIQNLANFVSDRAVRSKCRGRGSNRFFVRAMPAPKMRWRLQSASILARVACTIVAALTFDSPPMLGGIMIPERHELPWLACTTIGNAARKRRFLVRTKPLTSRRLEPLRATVKQVNGHVAHEVAPHISTGTSTRLHVHG